MTKDELQTMIQELAARTDRGEIPWGPPADFVSILYQEYLTLQLEKSRVDVYRDRAVGGEVIIFLIKNEKGDAVFRHRAKRDDPLYDPLDHILEVTLRKARKVDETIKDVQNFLKKKPG